MNDRIRVDTAQLDELGRDLATVRDRLAETRNEVDSRSDAIGSGDVLGALRNFEDHWNRGRRQLTESADALAQMVQDSAASYVDVDVQLHDGLTTESSSAQTGGAL